jgi:hypothetical protein
MVKAVGLEAADTSVVFGAIRASTPGSTSDAIVADEAHASFARLREGGKFPKFVHQ